MKLDFNQINIYKSPLKILFLVLVITSIVINVVLFVLLYDSLDFLNHTNTFTLSDQPATSAISANQTQKIQPNTNQQIQPAIVQMDGKVYGLMHSIQDMIHITLSSPDEDKYQQVITIHDQFAGQLQKLDTFYIGKDNTKRLVLDVAIQDLNNALYAATHKDLNQTQHNLLILSSFLDQSSSIFRD